MNEIYILKCFFFLKKGAFTSFNKFFFFYELYPNSYYTTHKTFVPIQKILKKKK